MSYTFNRMESKYRQNNKKSKFYKISNIVLDILGAGLFIYVIYLFVVAISKRF